MSQATPAKITCDGVHESEDRHVDGESRCPSAQSGLDRGAKHKPAPVCGDLRMVAQECRDRIRFRLSDDSGSLRFETFEIVNAPECREFEAALKEHLIGRPLENIDVAYLRSLNCDAECMCVSAVIREVAMHQRIFGRLTENGSACS